MAKATRGRYTLVFKQEEARHVGSGRVGGGTCLRVVEQPLANWVQAHRAGSLKGACNKPVVIAGKWR